MSSTPVARDAEVLAAMGTMAAGLSHEIKNPINAAAFQLGVLERRIGRLPREAQPELRGPLTIIKDEVARLNRIVQELLGFASPRELFKVPVDLAPLLGHVADFLTPQAEASGVHLVRRWNSLPTVVGDEGPLKQAIVNLVLNAIQATDPAGTVCIEAIRREHEVLVSVEDTGSGIAAEIRSRIFEPFFTTKPGGSGLGLPVVQSIVERHGGTISVERAQDGGARFVIRLPTA